MINRSMFRNIFLALGALLIVACDTDFNELGADIIEDDIHHNMSRIEASVVAFDRPTGPVQANNLPINSLGIYTNPAFGKTTATFVTQLQLASVNPQFSTNVIIDTVYLYVPYFSKLESVNSEGENIYSLDSIYGYGNEDTSPKMKLSVYRNGYFLRDSDPGTTTITGQKYYTDEKELFYDQRYPSRINNGPVAENDEFYFSNKEVARRAVVEGELLTLEKFAPGMLFNLDATLFNDWIIHAPAGKLVNNNVFKDYFRGLFFDIEQTGADGAMARAQFSKGKVVIIYHEDTEAGTEGTPSSERVRKTLTLNMTGNTVNFFENEYLTDFTSAITSSDPVNGDDRLYVKGGEGSLAFIQIDADDFAQLKPDPVTGIQQVLVNEANLKFYVDETAMAGAPNPLRLYLYDLKNKRPVYDYYTDVTSNTIDPKYNKILHGGFLQRDEDGNAYYKIRITDHINNLINKDSTNVRLGLAVTESINVVGNAALRNTADAGTIQTTVAPAASVIHPLGTILYGNNIPAGSADENKRLKLEIFYTKPN